MTGSKKYRFSQTLGGNSNIKQGKMQAGMAVDIIYVR